MFNLEEILKEQGYTEADIEANKVLLQDPRFRGALEKTYGAMETDLGNFRKENEGWSEFWNKKKTELDTANQSLAEAVSRAGSLEARLNLAEEAGFVPARPTDPSATPNPNPSVAQPEPFDPKKYNLITKDEIGTFAAMEGEAIALANDLAEEYRLLTGKSLLEYQATDRDGRTRKGMSALLSEARNAKKPIDQYVSEKFDFAGKRAKIADEQRKAAEDAIRKDERTKVLSEYGNPNTRPLMPSTQPFIPRTEGTEAKMPWEIPAQERRAARLERAMQNQLKGTVQ